MVGPWSTVVEFTLHYLLDFCPSTTRVSMCSTGIRLIYDNFDQCSDVCGVDISIHCHGRKLSVPDKLVRDEHPETKPIRVSALLRKKAYSLTAV